MAHMKYSIWEKCPKCSGAFRPQLIDPETLRITCLTCGNVAVRAALDADGRQNIVDRLHEATDKTRGRTIDRIADHLAGSGPLIKAAGVVVPEWLPRVLAGHVRKLKHQPSGKITTEGEVV